MPKPSANFEIGVDFPPEHECSGLLWRRTESLILAFSDVISASGNKSRSSNAIGMCDEGNAHRSSILQANQWAQHLFSCLPLRPIMASSRHRVKPFKKANASPRWDAVRKPGGLVVQFHIVASQQESKPLALDLTPAVEATRDEAEPRGESKVGHAAADVFTNILAQMRNIDWASADDLAVAQAMWGTMAVMAFGPIYSQVHHIGWAAADRLAHDTLKDMVGIQQPEWLASVDS
ncbi:hypothetical protein B0H19DRAFT_1237427 [Mycena capillaripes]|nr:hypothetical protein B0H19DRAFT_1237427 [Mycena capillaripes]